MRESSMWFLICFQLITLKNASPTEDEGRPRLHPLVFPEFISAGKKVTVLCAVHSGSRPLTFSWRKDGIPLEKAAPNTVIDIQPEYSAMTISPAYPVNIGNYSCTVENKFGSDTGSGSLNLRAPPTWQTEPQNAELAEGNILQLNCAADGHPKPEIKWSFKGADGEQKLLLADSRIALFPNGTLLISSIRSSDDGEYTCDATNGFDSSITKTVQIRVHEAPTWVNQPTDVRTTEGNFVEIKCSAEGNPNPQISWKMLKDGLKVPLANSDAGLSLQSFTNGSLIIQSPKGQDEGVYECEASNGVGNSLSKEIQIVVSDNVGVMPFSFPKHVAEGLKLTVTCAPTREVHAVKFQWLKDGNHIIENQRIRVTDYTDFSTLIINHAETEDSGNYTCLITEGLSSASYTSALIVQAPPVWIQKPVNTETVEGKNVTFQCRTAGQPAPSVTWKKREGKDSESSTVLPSGGRFVILGDILTVVNVQKDDRGVYECAVSNGVGKELKESAILMVLKAPRIQPSIFPNALSIGQKASVACGVNKGTPPLKFMWSKDGKAVSNSENIEITAVKQASMLFIDPVTSQSGGNYTCHVENNWGKDSFTFSLVVKAPPSWVKQPTDQTAFIGSTVLSKCEVHGQPTPTVTWSKKDSHGQRNKIVPGAKLQISNDGELSILDVKEEDGGIYVCEADNGAGSSLSAEFTLIVHVPARFEEKFTVKTVRQGDSAVLRCDVTGDPPLTITWFKDKRELEITELSRYEKFETISKNGINSELFIRNVDRRDGALYSCTASNSYGSDERNIKVLVVEVPAQPLDVKSLEVWAKSVSIRWSAPYTGNSPITSYKVQYWRDKQGPQTLHEQEVSASQTTAVIQDLKPGTAYALAVVAENEIGHGEPSETVRFTTSESEPSGPPTDLYVEARGPTSILVKWKPPPKECWNGELKGYYVGYRGEGISQPYTFRSVEATNNESNEYTITGLGKSARYSVLVKAYNKAGSGPPSQELVIRTLDGELPKSPPLSLVGSTDSEITVKWNQVVTRDDPLTGYTLHYQRGTGHWLHVPLVPADQSSYTLTGLQADTLYHVYLTANNKHGRGQASEIIAIKTREKGARDSAFYTDISIIIPSAAALVAVIVVIIVIIVYVTKSRSREGLVKDQIKALHDQQQQYIYAAGNSQRYADMDKGQGQGRPFSQGEPGTPAVSLASYASIPSRIDQDELYGGPVEVKGPYGQNYKERPSSFPRPNSKRAQTRPPPPPHT